MDQGGQQQGPTSTVQVGLLTKIEFHSGYCWFSRMRLNVTWGMDYLVELASALERFTCRPTAAPDFEL